MEIKDIEKIVESGKAKFVGESKWIKNAATQVYQIDNKFYAIDVYDSQAVWILEDSIREITELQIKIILE